MYTDLVLLHTTTSIKNYLNLSLPQVALLAGLPQAPNSYDPYANADQAKERRDLVLYSMKENGKITKEQYDQAVATPVLMV